MQRGNMLQRVAADWQQAIMHVFPYSVALCMCGICAYMRVHVYVCECVRACMSLLLCVCICVCVCVCVCACECDRVRVCMRVREA